LRYKKSYLLIPRGIQVRESSSQLVPQEFKFIASEGSIAKLVEEEISNNYTLL
jgi:hypothetical protein